MTALVDRPERIWTIGHSTRSIAEFIAALAANGIRLVADVRLLPGSKRYPHFNRDALADSLGTHGIRYEHFPELGGRRTPRPDSRNSAWRNNAFRGCADHMESDEFRAGIERLIIFSAGTGRTALMCAEAVWWRCHRALLSDYFKARGLEVLHIFDEKKTQSHQLRSQRSLWFFQRSWPRLSPGAASPHSSRGG